MEPTPTLQTQILRRAKQRGQLPSRSRSTSSNSRIAILLADHRPFPRQKAVSEINALAMIPVNVNSDPGMLNTVPGEEGAVFRLEPDMSHTGSGAPPLHGELCPRSGRNTGG